MIAAVIKDPDQAALALCRQVYDETLAFYETRAVAMGTGDLGFRILYGPPVVHAPLLFIGYQPGGDAIRDLTHHTTWPETCDYAEAEWPLAKRIREIWGKPTLAVSTGLNLIFFRAQSAQAWRRLPRPLRAELEDFSRSRLECIVRALAPQQIIAIGLRTFDSIACGEADTLDGKRVLLKRGTLWGIPLTGVIHLTGARMAKESRAALAAYFARCK